MVDVVANHAGPIGFDFGKIFPFDKAEHYHDYCLINPEDFQGNQWRVENCRLADLPDLKQENQWVRSTLINWIRDLIQKYDIDGIRIDTIPEVPGDFWSEFTQAAGVYQVGEVFDGRTNYIAGYQKHMDALLNYPLYFLIRNVFLYGQSMYNIRSIHLLLWMSNDQNWLGHYNSMNVFRDQSVLGNFVDNHDNARFLHDGYKVNRFKNGLVMSLMTSKQFNMAPILIIISV